MANAPASLVLRVFAGAPDEEVEAWATNWWQTEPGVAHTPATVRMLKAFAAWLVVRNEVDPSPPPISPDLIELWRSNWIAEHGGSAKEFMESPDKQYEMLKAFRAWIFRGIAQEGAPALPLLPHTNDEVAMWIRRHRSRLAAGHASANEFAVLTRLLDDYLSRARSGRTLDPKDD